MRLFSFSARQSGFRGAHTTSFPFFSFLVQQSPPQAAVRRHLSSRRTHGFLPIFASPHESESTTLSLGFSPECASFNEWHLSCFCLTASLLAPFDHLFFSTAMIVFPRYMALTSCARSFQVFFSASVEEVGNVRMSLISVRVPHMSPPPPFRSLPLPQFSVPTLCLDTKL